MKKHASYIYCAVCEAGREKPELHHPYLHYLLFALGAGALVGFALGVFVSPSWGLWSGFLATVLSFFGNEVYSSVKFKHELECPVCHFNPVLYRRSPEQAKQRCLESLKGKRSQFFEQWNSLEHRKMVETD